MSVMFKCSWEMLFFESEYTEFLKKRLWLFIVVSNNKSYFFFRFSHDVVTCDVDRDISTAYC